MKIKQRTLPNGLQVVSLQDNSTATVAIRVLYKVGSKDDPEGRSGFAHLFEHLMFKSTKNMKSEMIDRLTEDVGGYNNASTWDDFTNYYEVVPSNYLETLLWAEAERMVNLNVDEANFLSERDVVKEEFRQRILAQPYGMLFGQYIEKLSFTVHPYRRPGIGNLEELEAATLEDVQKFYKTFYRPDNAVLIVVGDFRQEDLDFWVNKYFGRIPKPESEIPRVRVIEPERTEEKRFVKTAPNVPFPAVAITYLAPPSDSKDVPALRIAEIILSEGESSRLYQSLVYRQRLAQEAAFDADIRVDKGLLIFYSIASEGKTPEQLEKALMDELKRIQQAGVTQRELQKAKNQLITQVLKERETNDGKASAIERAIAFRGNAEAVNLEIQEIKSVTALDVQNVMKKYFADNKRVVIYYVQERKE
ncbi:MAG: insulinase family protein [Pyrinomonadaceae bacterium]|nr:insulinase family protein [Pyrinomonadaceae bacterium]MDW8305188.1 pitrilysin family protein [Acidobacteriota bacterium]